MAYLFIQIEKSVLLVRWFMLTLKLIEAGELPVILWTYYSIKHLSQANVYWSSEPCKIVGHAGMDPFWGKQTITVQHKTIKVAYSFCVLLTFCHSYNFISVDWKDNDIF